MTTVDEFVNAQRERMLDELRNLLRIQSISTNPARASECRCAAEWIADHLGQVGAAKVELLGSDTHPVVTAEGPRVPGRPTVLVYGHYDVQPPEPLDAWGSPPFEPTIRNGDLVARGATDDKGQLFAVIKAFETITGMGTPPLNLRFLIEGEEESGGQVLSHLVEQRPDLLRADVVLIADSSYYAPGWPSVVLGVRGICYVEITMRTLLADVHSGIFGGVAPNAHEALVGVLASLKTPTGRLRIPGVYDAVRRPGPAERKSWERLPFDPQSFARNEVGARALVGDNRYNALERMWARPSLDIHGISGGFVDEGVKTIIPAVARAKVSLRLVPDQRATTVLDQLTRFVRSEAPGYADVEVHALNLGDPTLVDARHPAFAHLAAAFRAVEGREPVFTRSGGSLPIVGELAGAGASVILAGIGLPDDRLHAPNEKISLSQFFKGIRIFSRFLLSYGGCVPAEEC